MSKQTLNKSVTTHATIIGLTIVVATFSIAAYLSKLNLSNTKNNQITQEENPNWFIIDEYDNYKLFAKVNKEDEPMLFNGNEILLNKETNHQIEVSDIVNLPTIMLAYNEGKHILVSQGADVLRRATIIDAQSGQRVVEDFCMNSLPYFWKDYVIYMDCTGYDDIPWNNSPNIIAKHLPTNNDTKIVESSNTSFNYIKSISGDELEYTRRQVSNPEDWIKDRSEGISKKVTLTNLLR